MAPRVVPKTSPPGQGIPTSPMSCPNIQTDRINTLLPSHGIGPIVVENGGLYRSRLTPTSSGTYPPLMYKESERLKTFEGWPVAHLTPKQMTSAGFYFLKYDDIVRCAFCNVEVGHWDPGDDPMKDHKRWSPSCRFVRNVPNIGNIPVEEGEGGSGSSSEENGIDTCGHFGIMPNPKEGNISLERLKIQRTHPSSFPSYATPESRLRSFESWPVSLRLKPHMLSEAGFFYTGKGDQTLCFHCGGGLKDWEETDDPWVEHARWFSKCGFVIMMKGQTFIDEVSGEKRKQELERNLSASTGDLDELIVKNSEKKQEEEGEQNIPPPSSSTKEESQGNVEAKLCKICFGAEMGVAFLPCGHVVACPQCAIALQDTKCVTCRQQISASVRVYLS